MLYFLSLTDYQLNLVLYIHFQVTHGERLTLTLWFSRDSSHDEDAKLISILSQKLLHRSDKVPQLCLPLPASSNMYWFSPNQASPDELGCNICWARMNVLGYDIYYSQNTSSAMDCSELLLEPLQLARGDDLFHQPFANILHALQVFQLFSLENMFYCWHSEDWICLYVNRFEAL